MVMGLSRVICLRAAMTMTKFITTHFCVLCVVCCVYHHDREKSFVLILQNIKQNEITDINIIKKSCSPPHRQKKSKKKLFFLFQRHSPSFLVYLALIAPLFSFFLFIDISIRSNHRNRNKQLHNTDTTATTFILNATI
jgi:hypothetical protein